ncbi:cellulose binding domain-containing protein [Actinoplanes sp. KI2]|uniref:cellulose binding domain-containing protein n=1 Tax=Actinoplanes sp. KI2 TaxID=2983315 RepID=UPI0021D5B8B2|nr:cellulose binding domain-containing protein [Actinoplanes sp. KI2]MCU7729002.1 cellulose binding domain-containing protein [Actinoplanes sp. KI2]
MSRPRVWFAATLLAATLLTVAARPAAAALPAPGDLHVTAITPVSVTLAWTAADGATDYQINYHQAFNDVLWSQPAGNVTTATVTGYILGGRQYTFSVSARDATGGGYSTSNSVTVVTPVSTTGDTTPPATPANFRLTEVTATGPALAWDAATDNVGVAGYDVYLFDGWYTSTLLGTTTGTSITVPFGSSPSTGMHYYYARARDAAGNVSIATNTVQTPTTTTTPPPQLCQVGYKTTSEWSTGFVAEVTITNKRTTAVNGWTATVTLGGDQRVTSAWNATATQTGATVTMTAPTWNRTIPAGGSVTVGLLGGWHASDAPPISATLNGAACTLA